MKKVFTLAVCAALSMSLYTAAFAAPEAPAADGAVVAEEGGESAGEEAGGESAGGSGEGESAGDSGSSEPTYTESAEADPDKAVTLDGIAMGQVRQLVTTASIMYDGGVLDEAHSTMANVTEEDGVTKIVNEEREDDVVGIAIRNTGSFVLGGQSDPDLVAERLNFSFVSGDFGGDWDKFCEEMGYPAGTELADMAADIVANSSSSSYTNVVTTAPETVVLNDYYIDLAGSGSNDMGGFGAAVYVSDNAVAELNNFRVITRGPGRGTLFTRFGAQVTVNNSTFYAVSDDTIQTMQGCPPGLFLEGHVRATNAVGASHVTYNDSIVISQGWGALSTDSDDLYTVAGDPTVLSINNSYIAVLTSGYGAYSDGAAEDYFVGSVIDVPDYAAVETGSGIVSFDDCYINAGMYGVMTHSGNSKGDIIFKNSEIHVGETIVMLRDTANNVEIDNCTLAFDGTYEMDQMKAKMTGVDVAGMDGYFGTFNGVYDSFEHTIYKADDSNCIVKLIHNSDSGSGTESTGAAPVVTIKNSTMAGDILNTAAMEGDENTATSGPAGEGVRTARSLEVTLDASDISGAISLGSDTWSTTYFASGSNTTQAIGYASATELGSFHDEGFGLSLTLVNASTWTALETSYLTELTIDETSKVVGTITVDGEVVEGAGTYTGEIVVEPDADAVAAYEEAKAAEEAAAAEAAAQSQGESADGESAGEVPPEMPAGESPEGEAPAEQ